MLVFGFIKIDNNRVLFQPFWTQSKCWRRLLWDQVLTLLQQGAGRQPWFIRQKAFDESADTYYWKQSFTS